MSTTESRIQALANKHFGMEVNINEPLPATEISSLDMVAFLNRAAQEFQVAISSIDAEQFNTIQDLVSYIDERL